MENKTTQYEFKAEVKQLLDILVHSLYTNREIFLRELISNASDALDKLRFESNRGIDFVNRDLPFEIKIKADKDNKIVTISDTGIGMTKDEIISNIGTIAKSGAKEFVENILKSKSEENDGSVSLIGKFGVGFYSVYMVAEKVVIKTKSYYNNEPAFLWTSDGQGTYEITEIGDNINRGTTIEVYLKEETKEFADEERIKDIVKRHSNFISFPIFVGEERINTQQALWREPKFQIKQEQYIEFYKFLSHYSDEPLSHLHISVDAPIQFNSILYIPKKNFDMFGFDKDNYGLDLYVRRVLIQKKFKDLIPQYFHFVEGVVDSEDIPLNISRETLQENQVISVIARSVKNQLLDHLIDMSKNEPEKYLEFWKEHSKYFKFGYSDYQIKDKFAELIRFNSSNNQKAEELTSLEEYCSRVKNEQKEIYYSSGQSRAALENNPHLEILRKKGIEVFYLYDPVDEFVFESLGKYKEFEFKSAESVDLTKLEKYEDVIKNENKIEKLTTDQEKGLADLIIKMETILKDRVTKIQVSKRLTGSPCCLVSPDGGMSSHLQKMMQIMNKDSSVPKKVFEINKDHKLIRNLLTLHKSNPDDTLIDKIIEQMFESSLLVDGYLNDPNQMVTRMNIIMEKATEK